MWGKKKKKKQSMESVELNDDQLDAVSGGLITLDCQGFWRVVTDKGKVYDRFYGTRADAERAALLRFRSTELISWDDVKRRQRENC